MQIKFLEIARIELDDAVSYYNHEMKGLGDKFLTETLKTLDRIGKFPRAWQPCSKRTRRCRLRHFPYGIIHQILDNEILITAIANLHRKPEYWQSRL